MARIVASVFVATAFLLTAAAPAIAQKGDSGSIVGYVMDQNGAPIRGVKVTASAPHQIGGKKITQTNEEGYFRFPMLEPGKFNVRAEAPKLKTVEQQNVNVGISAPSQLDIIMEIASDKIEEVKVVEKAPLVSTTTANVKEVYDIDFVDSMPHDNRDVIYSQITNYSAGTIRGGRIRGGGGTQTLYEMDGFNMLRQYPTLNASAAYEIQTAGYGSEHANAPGGVVNLVTKSGSNKFEAGINATFDDNRLRLNDSRDSRAGGHFYVLNPMFAGPIVKDRLWYSANVEFLNQKSGRDPDPLGNLPEPLPELRNWYKGTVKLTWQVTSRNKLQSITNFDEWWQFHRTGGLGFDRDSQSTGRSKKYFSGLVWESVLSDSIVFRSQAGIITLNNRFSPSRCLEEPVQCNHVPATIETDPTRRQTLNNATGRDANDVYSFQFINRLEFFFNSKTLGEHNIQLKDNLIGQQEIFRRSVPGDYNLETLNGAPQARIDYYSNDPRFENARRGWFITSTNSLRNLASLSDTWRPTRHLTITPGVAFATATATNSRGVTALTRNALTPSLAVAWDATHDGRTVLRASFNQYVDLDLNPIAQHTVGQQVAQRCQWNPDTNAYDRNCTFSGGAAGNTLGKPCGPSGVTETGESCLTPLVIPKTWEYTAGGEREVIEGLSLSLDFIYRLYANQYERSETNRIWNTSGSAVTGFRDGRNQQVFDMGTPDDARRRYMGITGGVTRREGKMKVHAAYTWSRLDGTVLDGNNNRFGDIRPRDVFLYGPLGDDHRHEVKVNMSYQFTKWLSTSVRYNYYSGLPYNRLYRNDVTQGFDDFRARTGYSAGANINDPGDDRELRLPDFHSLNAQFIFNLQPFIGHRLETFVDILNILNQRNATEVAENDGADFGLQRAWQAPLRGRFGLRYRY